MRCSVALGHEQCEREAGDECVVHRRGLQDGAQMTDEMAEQAGWECYAVGINGLLRGVGDYLASSKLERGSQSATTVTGI